MYMATTNRARKNARKALQEKAAKLTAESTTGAWYGLATDRDGKDIIVCVPGR
jgi:hypothetical protein